jgi:GntR family transcriptional regulator
MFVMEGARGRLLKDERSRFLEKEWPLVLATIERLGLHPADLLQDSKKSGSAGGKHD